MRSAILFDIDGTLIDSERIDADHFVRAAREILGCMEIPDDWSHYTKVTDAGVISEILERNGSAPSADIILAVRQRFGSLLQDYLDRGGRCEPVPGAQGFMNRLRRHPAFSVGIATGGWEVTARMKLASAGFDIDTIPLSSSDDAEERHTIMEHCLARMTGPFGRLFYVGDGLWDRDACERLGWTFIGIGEKLRGRCDRWFPDFEREDELMSLLGV